MRHTNWRGCAEWRDIGFQFSTSSNEAVKLYDAALSQLMGLYEEPSVDGMDATLKNLHTADPNWVMGHAMSTGLALLGTGIDVDTNHSFSKQLDTMFTLAEAPNVTYIERLHMKACKAYADRNLEQACDIWSHILTVQPYDLWALRCLYTTLIYLGYSYQLRDIIARILPLWDENTPHYGYLYGLYAFGLNETNMFDQAEKYAKKALAINQLDAWATHSMAHVYEMQGRPKEGIIFMEDTTNDWTQGKMLACHNYWHLAVYQVEMGNHEEALGIFDKELIHRAKSSKSPFNMTDVSSMLFRLHLEGVDVNGRWSDVYELGLPLVDQHLAAFNDPHIMFACYGIQDVTAMKKLTKSMEHFIEVGSGTTHRITREVVRPICQSLTAFHDNNYAQAVDILLPVRYKVWQIGGSHAQRDVFNLFLIHCALKSPRPDHQNLSRQLLYERKANKQNSPMTDRLMTRIVQSHD